MTRAPASASRQVHIGAATACSSETTSSPESGSAMFSQAISAASCPVPCRPRAAMTSLTLIRPRQAEHVLGDIGEDEVGGDRRHRIEPGLAEFALDVEFLGKAEAAVGLQAHVG